MLGIQQRSRVRPEKLICSHLPFLSLNIPATIGPVSLCIGNTLGMVFSNETVVTLIHSSISAMIRNNVHNVFDSNLLFLSCGTNLLIVRDPSGVLVGTICVKTCSCFMIFLCERVDMK